MKKITSLGLWSLVLLLLSFGLTNHGQKGINFTDLSYKKVLEQAKTEGKPIFLEFYATWCGPCKFMNRHVFTKPKTGSYFNKNYISKKVNAETDEGPKLAKQFKVSAYPTLIFLDQNGKILLQTEGARTKNQLIKLGKQAKRKM